MLFLQRLFLVAATTLGLCGGLANTARADMEERLPLSHIQLDSPGFDNSGPIHVDLSQDQKGISELTITAFGKIRTVPKAQLATIAGSVFNIVGVSYSHGYANARGRYVYVLLYQGFSSGVQVAAIVAVPERGEVQVINKGDRSDGR